MPDREVRHVVDDEHNENEIMIEKYCCCRNNLLRFPFPSRETRLFNSTVIQHIHHSEPPLKFTDLQNRSIRHSKPTIANNKPPTTQIHSVHVIHAYAIHRYDRHVSRSIKRRSPEDTRYSYSLFIYNLPGPIVITERLDYSIRIPHSPLNPGNYDYSMNILYSPIQRTHAWNNFVNTVSQWSRIGIDCTPLALYFPRAAKKFWRIPLTCIFLFPFFWN